MVHIAVKPTSSIRLPRRSIDKQGQPVTVETHGRHDPCVGIRATPIAEERWSDRSACGIGGGRGDVRDA